MASNTTKPTNVVPFQPKPPLSPDQKITMLRRASPGVLTEAYLNFRGERDAAREAERRASAQMELIGGVIREKLDALDQDGFTAKGVVVYKQVLQTVQVRDPEALRQLVLDDPTNNLELLELRASIDGVRNYMMLHAVLDDEGYDVTPTPPGVELVEHHKLGVRKK